MRLDPPVGRSMHRPPLSSHRQWCILLVAVLLAPEVTHAPAAKVQGTAVQVTDKGRTLPGFASLLHPWQLWSHKHEKQQQQKIRLACQQAVVRQQSYIAELPQRNKWVGIPEDSIKQQQQQQQQQQPQPQQHNSWLRRLLGTVPFPGRNDPTLKPDHDMPGHFHDKWFEIFEQQWQDHNKAMQAVRVGNSTLAELARPLLLHNVTLVNPAQLKRAVGHMGSIHRLRRVLRDLKAGKPVKLAVLGGSISWGSAVERGEEDWFSLVVQHVKKAFPAANVTGRNGCVPATPSSFMNMCLEQYMDDDVDLVFVEYATNDGWDIHNIVKRKIYERLLRKILYKPKHPAVVLIQLPTVGMAFSNHHRNKTPFYKTVEDIYGAYSAYYDLPSLSMRNAIWRLAEFHHYHMNFSHYYGYTYDFIHPLEQGHRLIADMTLFALQQGFVDLLLNPWTMWDEEEVLAPLPKPMFNGNWEEVNRLCTNGKAFSSVVTQHEGWQMVNEGDDYKPKYGYVTQQVGAELVLTVNTTRTTAPELQRMNVQLAYLRSYTGMGMALVRCRGGCECQDTLVNGHHELHQSTIFLLRLYPTQAPKCQISVTVQSETHSAGHKFKVTGVMVNEFRDKGSDDEAAEGQEELNKEEWLGGVNKGDGELKERWSKAAKAVASASSDSSNGGSSSRSSNTTGGSGNEGGSSNAGSVPSSNGAKAKTSTD